jgi:hypothetical protein
MPYDWDNHINEISANGLLGKKFPFDVTVAFDEAKRLIGAKNLDNFYIHTGIYTEVNSAMPAFNVALIGHQLSVIEKYLINNSDINKLLKHIHPGPNAGSGKKDKYNSVIAEIEAIYLCVNNLFDLQLEIEPILPDKKNRIFV